MLGRGNNKSNSKRLATDIDLLVSKRIKMRRMLIGFNQHEMASAINVSVQQLQKYEHGINRVSAGKLHNIAEVLKTTINYFFTDDDRIDNPIYTIAEEASEFIGASHSNYDGLIEDELLQITENVLKLVKIDNLTDNELKDIILLIKEYISIKDYGIRKNIINLIKNINNQ